MVVCATVVVVVVVVVGNGVVWRLDEIGGAEDKGEVDRARSFIA
jgi:hypothetical protein